MTQKLEFSAGPTAWKTYLARLDSHSAPDDRDGVRARANALDNIEWFAAHPEVRIPGWPQINEWQVLVPKLQLGNAGGRSPASRDSRSRAS
jgi:hypothetical protein